MRIDLTSALKTSLEDGSVPADPAETLLAVLVNEANDLSPSTYVDERLEVEGDLTQIEQVREEILQAGDTISHEALDSHVRVINAAVHRYGGALVTTGFESATEPKFRASEVVNRIDFLSTSLESALAVSLESYSMRDMWDHLGILNREIPEMGKKIEILKTVKGKAKMKVGNLVQLFMVDGELVNNFSAAASDTAKIVANLLRTGEEATANALKAADIAYKVDWKDPVAAEKGLKAISSLKNPAKEIYDLFDEKWTLGNRKITVKHYDVKGGSDLGEWSKNSSINISWPKTSTIQIVGALFGPVGTIAVAVAQASNKREIQLSELASALEKIKAVAVQSAGIRNKTPNKWRNHETLVKKLKADVKGSKDAQLAVRVISEVDRMGWEAVNGAFTILYFIVRQLNDLADAAAKQAKD